MNEVQAKREGLSFTGSYSHEKGKQKDDAKIIRDSGFRAIVINCPPSRLSRGSHGMGYSVYAEKAYFENKNLIANKKKLADIPSEIKSLEEKYMEDLKELEEKEKNLATRIEEGEEFLKAKVSVS